MAFVMIELISQSVLDVLLLGSSHNDDVRNGVGRSKLQVYLVFLYLIALD